MSKGAIFWESELGVCSYEDETCTMQRRRGEIRGGRTGDAAAADESGGAPPFFPSARRTI